MAFLGLESEWNMGPEADLGIWDVDDPDSQPTIELPQFVDPRNGSLTNDATRDDTYGTWLGNEPEPAPSVGLDMGDNPHGPATQLEAMVFTGGDEFAADIEMTDVNDSYGDITEVPGHSPRYKTPVDFSPKDFTSMSLMPMTSMPMGTIPVGITSAGIPLVDITHADARPNVSDAMSSISKSGPKTRERRAPSIASSQHSNSTRTRHAPDVKARWEAVFRITPYPDSRMFQQLAKEADTTVKQVRHWFNNRRSKRSSKKGDRKEKGLNAQAPVFVPQRPAADSARGGFEILRTGYNPVDEFSPSSSGHPLSQAGTHARQGSHQLLVPPGTASMYGASQHSRPPYSYPPPSPPSLSNLTSTSRSSRNGRRQHAQMGPQSERADPSCRFQCLFCQASFDKIYSWQRHEMTQHFEMETYVCQGETVVPSRDGSGYVRVGSKNCSQASEERRTFYRKDNTKTHALKGHTIEGRGDLNRQRDAEIIEDLLSIWRREGGNETLALQARTCQHCLHVFRDHQARCKHMADVHFPLTPVSNNDTRVAYGINAIEERNEPYVTGGRLMGAAGAIVPHGQVAELGVGTSTAVQDLWMERRL